MTNGWALLCGGLVPYRLVSGFCSSPPSSSELWTLGSAFQSTASRLGCGGWGGGVNESRSHRRSTTCFCAGRRHSPLPLLLLLLVQVRELPPRVKVVPSNTDAPSQGSCLTRTHARRPLIFTKTSRSCPRLQTTTPSFQVWGRAS